MKTLTLIILIATSSLFACKNTSQAMGADKIVPSNSGKKPAQEQSNDVVYDMIVSFISKGAGIDKNVKEKVDAAIAAFNSKHGTSITPEKVGWGREGEVDYNFVAKNLSTAQKEDFSARIKEAIGSSDMAFVSYNKKSVHKR